MFFVTITEKGGSSAVRQFEQHEVTIGRVQGNDILLPRSNISKNHARIIFKANGFTVVDTKSTNGTYINGQRIDAPYHLQAGDKVVVGDFTLEISSTAVAGHPSAPSPTAAPEGPANALTPPTTVVAHALTPADAAAAAAVSDAAAPSSFDPFAHLPSQAEAPWSADWHLADSDKLFFDAPGRQQALELAPTPPPAPPPTPAPTPAPPLAASPELVGDALPPAAALGAPATMAIPSAPASLCNPTGLTAALPAEGVERRTPSQELYGPLAAWVEDPTVRDILINAPNEVFVARAGGLAKAPVTFASQEALLQWFERLCAAAGVAREAVGTTAQLRLTGGLTLNAVLPPLAPNGPVITVNKRLMAARAADLVAQGGLSDLQAAYLRNVMSERHNVVVSGERASDRAAVVGMLGNLVPPQRRVIAIAEDCDVQLEHPHVVQLTNPVAATEAAPGPLGREAALRALLATALTLRPDVLLVEACRGAEALDLLRAMLSGPCAVVTSLHASSPQQALERLATLAEFAVAPPRGAQLPACVAQAVQLVVHVECEAESGRYRIGKLVRVEGPMERADGQQRAQLQELGLGGPLPHSAPFEELPAWHMAQPAPVAVPPPRLLG